MRFGKPILSLCVVALMALPSLVQSEVPPAVAELMASSASFEYSESVVNISNRGKAD